VTLERYIDASGRVVVQLVECPFCGASIGPEDGGQRTRYTGAAGHLRRCDAFFRAMDVDPDAPLSARRTAAIEPTHP